MISRVARLVDSIVAVQREIVAMDGDEEPAPPPAEGASTEAIVRVEREHGRELPLEYVEFLRRHDGWPGFPYGPELFGADGLVGPAHVRARTSFDDASDGLDVPRKLRRALIIGVDPDGSEFLLLTRSGKVVSYRHGDVEKHADFPAYLVGQLRGLVEYRDSIARSIRDAEAQWEPHLRAARESALLDDLLRYIDFPDPLPPPATPPPPADPMPAPVAPADLVLRADDDDADDADADDHRAAVSLSLVLYLGSYPSREEVLSAYRAFRRHFPVPGTLSWAVPDRFFLDLKESPDPDDESWAAALRVNAAGLFGIRASVVTPRRYTINVCGIPPTDRGEPRASFCEVIVPVDEDPGRLAALARDLVDLLPVRSGHGGLTAYADGEDDEAYREIFGWCRRHFGLHVGYLDGWLEAATRRVVGAGWLTVLGPTLARLLAGRAPLRFASPEITVEERPGGTILTAGARPTLGDVHRGQFPVPMAEVDRHLRPLRVVGWHRRSALFTSGIAWDVTESQLPGAFRDHRATGAWLDRLTNPAGLLGPTPRERGVEWLERLHAEHPGDRLDAWRAADADGDGPFPELLRAISAAVLADPRSDLSVAALEFVTAFGKDTPTEAYNNLTHVYLVTGRLADALAFLPTALTYARKNPYLMHNAACVRALTGDTEGALKLVKRARKLQYELMDSVRTDEDLRALWDDPRFVAVFAD